MIRGVIPGIPCHPSRGDQGWRYSAFVFTSVVAAFKRAFEFVEALLRGVRINGTSINYEITERSQHYYENWLKSTQFQRYQLSTQFQRYQRKLGMGVKKILRTPLDLALIDGV